MGVYTAINWFFKNEDKGIIIEDDCVLQSSFFPFAEELLHRYEHDERIAMIDAANYIKNVDIPDSYGFSRFKSTNGWATWKRAWEKMDLNMEWKNSPYFESIIKNNGYNGKDTHYWKYRIKAIEQNYVSAWDWQWYFSLAAQNQLCIFPSVNLISNIGNDNAATHTSRASIYLERKELSFPLIHPETVLPDFAFDHAFYRYENMFKERLKRTMPYRLKQIVKKFLR